MNLKHTYNRLGIPALRWITVLTLLVAGTSCVQGGTANTSPSQATDVPAVTSTTGGGTRDMSAYPEGLYAVIDTSKGEIFLNLEFEKVPLTVMNFVGLAEGKLTTATRNGQKFYDGLVFHRVIKDFMIQGGDPEGNGSGGPGYRFADEFDPTLKHDKPGVLSMANAGPGTNGSQFFITHVPTPWLDGAHSVFGHVVSGQEVVDAIQQGDKISKVEIIRKGQAAEAFIVDQGRFDQAKNAASARNEARQEEERRAQETRAAGLIPNAKKTTSGIFYSIERAGTGPKPQKGQMVSVHYTGALLDGTVFDSSVQRDAPLEVNIGVGRLIPGWDEIVLDMAIGEKRKIVIPPELGYGARGAGGVIPPNAYLYFELELLGIK